MGRFAEWRNGRKADKPLTVKEVEENLLNELQLAESVDRQKELADVVLTLETARAKEREGRMGKAVVTGVIGTLIPTFAIIFAEDIRPLPSKAWTFVSKMPIGK